MNAKIRLTLSIVLFMLAVSAFPQDYESFFTRSQLINRHGMFVLGGWAVTNIVSGAVGWKYAPGDSKYFHQMNLFWNTVNLTIAGITLANTFSTDLFGITSSEMLKKHLKSERLYLINAGLDLIYIGSGYYLKYRSAQKERNKDLLSGYGKSIMLQGGFLLVFDLVMYLAQHRHRIHFLETENAYMSITSGGFLISCHF